MGNLREQFEQALRWLASRKRLLLVSHTKPDGDALGSLCGLARMIQGSGKTATVALFESCPERYAHLLEGVTTVPWSDVKNDPADAYDGLVVLDTCSFSQLEPVEDVLRASAVDVMVVDHHATRDAIGHVRVIDARASSTCLLVAELARTSGWNVDDRDATALFTGMATDTGWFRFSSVDSRTIEVVGWLMDRGVRPNEVYERLYLNEEASRIRLLAELLGSLELYEDDRLAVVTLPLAAFERSGATPAMTEDLINEPLRIRSVMTVVLFVEQQDGPVRVSFRSKRALNVAALAQRFGGGGHERAAGARIEGKLDNVKQRVLKEVRGAVAAVEKN